MTPKFHFRSVIGKLNFLEKSTRPDISVCVHQCARFSEQPKRSHAEAVKRIGRYLLAMRDRGLLIRPNELRLLNVGSTRILQATGSSETRMLTL